MGNVNYVLTEKSVTVNYAFDGERKTKTVFSGTSDYNKVVAAIKEGNLDDIHEIIDPAKKIINFGESFITVKDGVVCIDGLTIPGELGSRILAFADAALPYMPLVYFFRNLNNNTSFRAVQGLFRFLEANHHPLTEDGCFIAYKKVVRVYSSDDQSDEERKTESEDPAKWQLVDSYTKTFNNSIGSKPKVPRNQVDENPNKTCSKGLHVAAFEYANTYIGNVLIEVKVNPANVVAVPFDYNDQKMRVCEYEVLGITEGARAEQLAIDNKDCDNKDNEDNEDNENNENNEDEYCSDCGYYYCECQDRY